MAGKKSIIQNGIIFYPPMRYISNIYFWSLRAYIMKIIILIESKYTYHATFPLKSVNLSLLNAKIVVKEDFICCRHTYQSFGFMLLIKQCVRRTE
jgi:hypothetical protein